MENHGLGTYPMYHVEKVLEKNLLPNTEQVSLEIRRVELCHNKKIQVGDKIQYKNVHDLTFDVKEVIEERDSKGSHKDENVKWYNLILEYNLSKE